ncbi:MAG: YbhB/YbcL family Raf kinase inhibitor-like protein [Anaerolineales bacterium]
MKKILFTALAISVAACTAPPAQDIPPTETIIINPQTETETIITQPTEEVVMSFEITSPAFANAEAIPADYSCKGRNISPALIWSEPPAATQSFALIMDDPDAPMGTWVHWVLFNIPASTRDLKESTSTDPQLSDGSLQGKTSAGSNGYHGPCPPSGIHRYFFKLYALDTMLDLSSAADKKDLLAAMEGHILANAELTGTFSH